MLIFVLLALLVFAPAASADSIVFRCGDQICRAAPDGKLRTNVTGDGGYSWVSASADGTRLGVVRGGATYVLDGDGKLVAGALPRTAVVSAAQISPDGSQVATLEGGSLFTMGANGSLRTALGDGVAATGWLGSRPLRNDGATTCLLNGTACERVVAGGAGAAASPDGRFIAAARGGIAVFDTGTGALVRQLTTGAADGAPSFSPDGARVIFSRGNEIFVVPATGGSEKAVIKDGQQPVWVSGGAACRETLTAKPKAKEKTIEVTACAPSSGLLTITLVARDKRVARKKVRTKLGGMVTVSFKKPATKDKLRVTVRFQAS